MNTKLFSAPLLVLLVGGTMSSITQPAVADGKKTDKDANAATKSVDAARHPYLGVAIEPLHDAMAGHLPKVLVAGQGVLVRHVAPDSPAAKAGVQQHDILTMYGDQKLFSAEQLAKLVMADKVGREVELQLVRGGKLQSVHVTLAKGTAKNSTDQASNFWSREIPWFSHPRAAQNNPDKNPPSDKKADQATDWKSFDSLTLKRLDEKTFQAEVKYLDDHGKMVSHVFKGTRDEIEKDVKAVKDMPAGERNQLLNAIEHPQQTVSFPDFSFDRTGDVEFRWQPFPSFPNNF